MRNAILKFAEVPSSLFSSRYIPHRYCYLAQPGLVWTNALTDLLIGVSYCIIFTCLMLVVRKLRRIPEMRPYLWIILSFGAFIIACAGTHLMDVITIWWPFYPLSAAVKVLCAAISAPTAIYFAKRSSSIEQGIGSLMNSRSQALQAKADSIANYKGRIEAIEASHMVTEVDMQGRIIRANSNFLARMGYVEDELYGHHFDILLTPTYVNSSEYQRFWSDLKSGKTQSGQFEWIDKQGRLVQIESSYHPVLDPQGVPAWVMGVLTDITEQRKTQRELKDAEAQLRIVMDSVLAGIIMFDAEGIIVSINPSAIRMFEYSPDEVVGHNVKMLMPASDRGRYLAHLVGYQPASRSWVIGRDVELEGLAKNGRTFPVELTVTEASFQDDRIFIGLVRDISDRKRAERERERQQMALRKSEELLDRTGRMADVGGWEIDLVHRTMHWTDETARLHGFEAGHQPTLEEAINLYVPEFRGALRAAIEKAAIDGQPWELEAQVMRADKGRIWAMKKASVEFLDGKAVRMVGAFQDITARILAEEEVRYQANLLDVSHDTIMMRDLDGRIRFWNQGAQEMYGYAKQRAVGQISHSLLQTVFPIPLAEIEAEVKAQGRWEGELVHTTQSGQQIVVASRWVLQQDQNGRTFNVLETNNDITERKRAEEVSRKAMVVAEEANRAKSEFLANMSHEIRTPMNAIMGMTHLALRANPTPQQGGYLKKIESAADSLLKIVNDILDFSKMGAGKMELENIPFAVEKVLTNLNDIVSQTAKRKNIAISFSIAKEVPAFLVGDPLRLGQILINLVNNGIKFTREGSVSITVSADRRDDDTAQVSFAVVDTGIGMGEEQLAKLFKSFNQADASVTRRFGGTGLGLAISKQLCELMGGTISAVSKEGKGSTFTLQVQFGIATGIESLPANEENQDPGRKTVLVVDDSADARDVLVAMLTANGFDSRTVSSGEEVIPALDAAWSNHRPFDLVLMDWRMPGMNGVETARKIDARLQSFRIPPIVMVSAFDREQVMHGGVNPGLGGFLIKPVKESVLIETIRALLRERHEENGVNEPSSVPVRISAHPKDLAGLRVLLVEDNEINRDLATELLTDLGILVSVAVDGREGVDRIAAEPFDLVLMDIQMPVMDGLTATRLVRSDARFSALPIIAMTAHAMSGDREKSLAAGMNDHLTKPISPERLTDTLLRWMPRNLQMVGSSPSPEPVAALSGESLPEGSLPEELAPFDLRAALVRTNGKPMLLRKMMLSFRTLYAEAGSELRLLVSQGKMEEAERVAHSLKGSARTLEANLLGDTAEAIEVALRTGALLGLDALIDAMEMELTPAIAAAATLDRRILAAGPAVASLEKGTILIVDDDLAYLELLTDIFSSEHKVLSASRGVEAVAIATAMVPDVILLDVMMHGLDGYEVCSLLKKERLTCDIPVIFLTGLGDVANESKALAMGAVDFVTKPINPLAVRARVNHQIELKRAHDRLMKLATEDLLAQLRKEAERAQELQRISKHELELRDHFLSHVSHELRSPLTAIYMFSSLIADGLAGATTPEQDEYLAVIAKNVDQLKAMIEDLLSVTRAKTGKLEVHMQSVSLVTAVVDAVHTVQSQSEMKGVALSSSVSNDLAAFADPVRLLQVLIILCDNAIKFTPSGGSVRIEVHPFEVDPNFLLVEVSDTGRGIQPEMTERIFEHLYQISDVSDAGRNGLGLGLHIARELINRQGGKIWAEALPMAGSRFSFTVPVFREEVKSIGLSLEQQKD